MGPLTRECRPENLIATVRGTLAAMEQRGRVPSAWRVGMDFWAAFQNSATVLKSVEIEHSPKAIREALASLPQPTMGGLPVFVDPNMEHNKAALLTKEGGVVTIIELGASVSAGIKTGDQ